MRTRGLLLVVPTLAIAAMLTLSCKDKPAENTVDAAASAAPAVATVAPLASTPPATSASSAREEGGGKRAGRGGPAAMLFHAARSLELKDETKTKIDAAEKTAQEGAGDGMREAAKELHTELLTEVRGGKIETAKLEPKFAAIEKIAAAGHAKEADALNALYAALDAVQRKAVVANVRAKQAAREAKMEARGQDDAGAPDGGAGAGAGRRSLDRLTRGLDLDADQQKKVDAIAAKEDASAKPGRPDLAEMKKKVESLLAAFEKDGFDAKKVDAFDAKKARGPMDQEAKLIAQLVPILKPEQRERLATKMEKAPRGRHGGNGEGSGHRPHLEPEDDD